MRVIRRAALFMPEVFGFMVIALVIAAGSCRFNRVKAQQDDDEDLTVKTHWCNRDYYIEHYGDPDWHLIWALHGCWIYDNTIAAPTTRVMPRRLVIGGR